MTHHAGGEAVPDGDDFIDTEMVRLLKDIPANELRQYLTWRLKVKGTNISAKTLLATDYLNHFNEIGMLIEMLPDMPDMLEECYQWQPKTYQEHFRDSGFSDRDLAIEAYNYVPTKFRRPLEDTIEQMQLVVSYTIHKVATSVEGGNLEQLREDCRSSTEMIYKMIQVMNGIIHGTTKLFDQDEIDTYLGLD